jgi:hypothetical protein
LETNQVGFVGICALRLLSFVLLLARIYWCKPSVRHASVANNQFPFANSDRVLIKT